MNIISNRMDKGECKKQKRCELMESANAQI
jgi:hypothetical protein